jgi:hypothetical protein
MHGSSGLRNIRAATDYSRCAAKLPNSAYGMAQDLWQKCARLGRNWRFCIAISGAYQALERIS